MSLYFFLSPKHAVELNKQISCTLQLTNKTDKQVAFKVKRIILVNSSGKSSVITRKWQRWDWNSCNIAAVGQDNEPEEVLRSAE